MNHKEIKQAIIKNRQSIKDAYQHLHELHEERNHLIALCEQLGHKIVPRDKKMLEELGCTSAICKICQKDFGWYCEKSPDHYCHYEGNAESCIYCGLPEERK